MTTQAETDVLLAFGQLGSALGVLEAAAEQAPDREESGKLYQEYLDSLSDMVALALESFIDFADATDEQLTDICKWAMIRAREASGKEDAPGTLDDLLAGIKELVGQLKPSAPSEKTAA